MSQNNLILCNKCKYREHWRYNSCWQCEDCSKYLQRGHNYEPRTALQKVLDLLKGYDENNYKNLR